MKLTTRYKTKEAFIKAIEEGVIVRVHMCPKRTAPIFGPMVVRENGWGALVILEKDRVVRVIS